jgi:hypothetical protein
MGPAYLVSGERFNKARIDFPLFSNEMPPTLKLMRSGPF